jgi:hypothetical protein
MYQRELLLLFQREMMTPPTLDKPLHNLLEEDADVESTVHLNGHVMMKVGIVDCVERLSTGVLLVPVRFRQRPVAWERRRVK